MQKRNEILFLYFGRDQSISHRVYHSYDEIFEKVAVDDIFKDKRLVAGAASRKLLCKVEAEDEE